MSSGLLDASVVIDWHDPLVLAAPPDEVETWAIAAAELAAGPHLASSRAEAGEGSRGCRRLGPSRNRWRSTAQPHGLAFIADAVAEEGRTSPSCLADLLIADTARANSLDLYTGNGDDFVGLHDLVNVAAI